MIQMIQGNHVFETSDDAYWQQSSRTTALNAAIRLITTP